VSDLGKYLGKYLVKFPNFFVSAKYSNIKWQDACTDCPLGYTTETTGNTDQSSCKRKSYLHYTEEGLY
jgi:hypothetical protein